MARKLSAAEIFRMFRIEATARGLSVSEACQQIDLPLAVFHGVRKPSSDMANRMRAWLKLETMTTKIEKEMDQMGASKIFTEFKAACKSSGLSIKSACQQIGVGYSSVYANPLPSGVAEKMLDFIRTGCPAQIVDSVAADEPMAADNDLKFTSADDGGPADLGDSASVRVMRDSTGFAVVVGQGGAFELCGIMDHNEARALMHTLNRIPSIAPQVSVAEFVDRLSAALYEREVA